MARALYSGVGIAGMSGSINKAAGGTTFGKNGVVRRRVVPVNPQTANQSLVRNAFAYYTSQWKTLSNSDRAAWEAARTGNVYWTVQDPLTGTSRPFASAKDMFINVNFNLDQANDLLGSPSISASTPPTPAADDVIGVTSVAFDDSSNSVTLTYTGTLLADVLLVRMTPGVSVGNTRLTSVKSKLRDSAAAVSAVSPATVTKPSGITYTGTTGLKVFWIVEAISLATGRKRIIETGTSTVVA